MEGLKKYREQIDELNSQIEIAKREYNLDKAAELQYGELPKLQREMAAAEARVKGKDLSTSMKRSQRMKLRVLSQNGREFQ